MEFDQKGNERVETVRRMQGTAQNTEPRVEPQ